MPTPPRAELPWAFEFDRILGRSVSGVQWAIAWTILGAIGAILLYRSTVEKPPGFPLQYAPPEGLGPVQTEYIRTESVSDNAVTATLFHLADRGLIQMNQVGKKKWSIRNDAKLADWADVDPVSLTLASALKINKPGGEFDANGTAKSGSGSPKPSRSRPMRCESGLSMRV